MSKRWVREKKCPSPIVAEVAFRAPDAGQRAAVRC